MEQLDRIEREIAEVKGMLRHLLDAVQEDAESDLLDEPEQTLEGEDAGLPRDGSQSLDG